MGKFFKNIIAVTGITIVGIIVSLIILLPTVIWPNVWGLLGTIALLIIIVSLLVTFL